MDDEMKILKQLLELIICIWTAELEKLRFVFYKRHGAELFHLES